MATTLLPEENPDIEGDLYAFLVESLDDEHEVGVLQGVLAGAREVDATVLCIAGGVIDDVEAGHAARNFAFEQLGRDSARGVLVLASAIGAAMGPDQLSQWARRYQDLPLCSLGIPIAPRPYVGVDNAGGVRMAVQHLIKSHGARRIAYVRGPDASSEARDRFQTFLETLRSEGIEPDPRLSVDGDYTKACGGRAVHTLLDERRVTLAALDAIVTCNDYAALGVIEELGRRGIAVPEQIKVVGFDDVESARLARPALTTVRQPAQALGREGIRRLARLAQGDEVEPTHVLPTELVIRRSCGCQESDMGLSARASMPSPGRGIETSFVQRRQIILAELVRAAHGSLGGAGGGWESRLLDTLISEIRGDTAGSFARAVESLLRRVDQNRFDPNVVHDVLSTLRRQSLMCIGTDAVSRDRLEEAAHEARIAASQVALDGAAVRLQSARDHWRAFEREAQIAMFGGPEEISLAASEHLPQLGIQAGVVARLETPGDVSGKARVLFGFRAGGRRTGGENVSLKALPFHPLLKRTSRALIFLPITVGAEASGAAVLSVSAVNGVLLEDLRDLLGTIFRVVDLKARLAPRAGA